MTRKDYELIAGVLAAALGRSSTWGDLTSAFAAALERDNPRFDRVRFYGAAAGVVR